MISPRAHLGRLGLSPSRARGQCFLKDANISRRVADLILKEAGGEGALVLEVGPGLGALTRPLLDGGARLWAAEVDRGLIAALEDWPEAKSGLLSIIRGDALEMSIPGLFPGELPTVCGNLPYNLSTPLIFWFLESRAPLGIFMLQKEMARRLWAGPGGKEYGRLSLAVSLFYQASPAFGVSAASFQPRPKVDSVLAILRRKGGPGNGPLSQAALGRLSAAAFHARRKTILNNLSAAYGKERALLALSDLGLDPGARPESIPPEKYHALAMSLEEGLFSHSHP